MCRFPPPSPPPSRAPSPLRAAFVCLAGTCGGGRRSAPALPALCSRGRVWERGGFFGGGGARSARRAARSAVPRAETRPPLPRPRRKRRSRPPPKLPGGGCRVWGGVAQRCPSAPTGPAPALAAGKGPRQRALASSRRENRCGSGADKGAGGGSCRFCRGRI